MTTDLNLLYLQGVQFIQDFWKSLGADGPYYVWLGSGVLGLLVWAVISYYVMRRLFGHRKYLGAWYNEKQYAELMQIIYEKQQKGNQVMSHAEVKALRQWQFGGNGEGIFGQQKNSYFS